MGSMGKIYNLGHKAILGILDNPVVVQEKIDGSFGQMAVVNGELIARSKGRTLYPPVKDKLFNGFYETAERLFVEGKLKEGYVYRGEVVSSPKHNVLKYNNVPRGNFILFDVLRGDEDYLTPEEIVVEAILLGLDSVPCFVDNKMVTLDELKAFTEKESCLGGVKMEGVVIKDYTRFHQDGKAVMGKLVRPEFKETHKVEWKSGESISEKVIKVYRNERRWEKAIQHLRDDGRLTESVKDIGPLIGEIQKDVQVECADEIKDMLFKEYWKEIGRGVTRGFPEWYKERLLNEAYPEEEEDAA